jgi:hypothetical protein
LVNGLQGGGSWAGGLCREAASLALCKESSLPRVKLSTEAILLKFNFKIAKWYENYPKLKMTPIMLCITYIKTLVVKLKFEFL